MPKSILDIEVKDDQFKAFIDRFNQYQEKLKELPGDWGNFDEGTRVTAENFASMTAALLTQREILHQQERDWAKQEEQEKRLLDLERRRKNEIHSIWEDTKRIASQVSSTTQDLFRWIGAGAILSGLAGAGGLWGLDALAHSVSDARKQAMGLGVNTGQLQAARINFGPYLGDPNSTLQGIAEAKSNLSEGWVWSALGLNPSQDPATLMQSAVSRAAQLFGKGQATPIAQDPRVKAFGELGISLEDLRRIHNATQQEIRDAEKQYQIDQKTLQITDEQNQEWQRFSVQMGRAEQQIKNTFVDLLTPVIPQLTSLSAELSKTIHTFLTTDRIKTLVSEVAKVLENFVKYIGTPKFESDMKTFADDVGQVAEALVSALKFLGVIKAGPEEVWKGQSFQQRKLVAWSHLPSHGQLDDINPWGWREKEAERIAKMDTPPWLQDQAGGGAAPSGGGGAGGAPAGGSAGGAGWDRLLHNIYGIESGFGKHLLGPMTPYGRAKGPFQLMDATAAQYGVTNVMDYGQSEKAARAYLMDLTREFGGDLRKALAAYNWGPAKVEKDVQLHGADWERYAPTGVQGYIKQALTGVTITIQNQTGAHVSTQAYQLPQ